MTAKRPTLSLKPAAKPGAKPAGKRTAQPAAWAASAAKPAPKAQTQPAPVAQTRSEPKASPQPAVQAAPASVPVRASYEVKPVLQPGYRPNLKGDSLALALLGAANAVAQVRGGTALPQALSNAFGVTDASAQARGAIQDIAYRAMRQLGRSDTLLGAMTSKAPEPPMLAGLLCCALALMDTEDGAAPYEPFTVVDQAVSAAGSHPDLAHAKGMVNAVLRRFLRERDELVTAALQTPLAQWNYPQWWIDAVKTAYPQHWQGVLASGNAHPPLTLRVNTRKTTLNAYLDLLRAAGIGARAIGPSAVRLDKAVGVGAIPRFEDGWCSVQDAAAQLAAPLLDVGNGMRVLDACAAPGGKTGHILELADVDVTAIDTDPKRLARVQDNLDRLGQRAQLLAADAQAADWWDGRQFDRIIADVPCTASGIVRRHPDIRWLRRKVDTLQLATLSSKILDNLWQMLRPDGKLLFVTCSIWPQESEAQAAAFAVRHNAIRLDAPGQLLPQASDEWDHDGLFYALFEKRA